MHRLSNAQLQKAELRGFQKMLNRFSFEIYEVTRFARTSVMQNHRVFVKEWKRDFPDIALGDVDTMNRATLVRQLRARRQPAPYPKGSQGRDGNNIMRRNFAPETRYDLARRLKNKLRQERRDILASGNGDGEALRFAYVVYERAV